MFEVSLCDFLILISFEIKSIREDAEVWSKVYSVISKTYILSTNVYLPVKNFIEFETLKLSYL